MEILKSTTNCRNVFKNTKKFKKNFQFLGDGLYAHVLLMCVNSEGDLVNLCEDENNIKLALKISVVQQLQLNGAYFTMHYKETRRYSKSKNARL